MAKKKKSQLTKFGDVAGALNPWLHEEARKTWRHKGSKAHPATRMAGKKHKA
jgi:hypothetical protein